MESIIMGKAEQVEIHTIAKLSEGKLSFREAMLLLGIRESEIKAEPMYIL